MAWPQPGKPADQGECGGGALWLLHSCGGSVRARVDAQMWVPGPVAPRGRCSFQLCWEGGPNGFGREPRGGGCWRNCSGVPRPFGGQRGEQGSLLHLCRHVAAVHSSVPVHPALDSARGLICQKSWWLAQGSHRCERSAVRARRCPGRGRLQLSGLFPPALLAGRRVSFGHPRVPEAP